MYIFKTVDLGFYGTWFRTRRQSSWENLSILYIKTSLTWDTCFEGCYITIQASSTYIDTSHTEFEGRSRLQFNFSHSFVLTIRYNVLVLLIISKLVNYNKFFELNETDLNRFNFTLKILFACSLINILVLLVFKNHTKVI